MTFSSMTLFSFQYELSIPCLFLVAINHVINKLDSKKQKEVMNLLGMKGEKKILFLYSMVPPFVCSKEN